MKLTKKHTSEDETPGGSEARKMCIDFLLGTGFRDPQPIKRSCFYYVTISQAVQDSQY